MESVNVLLGYLCLHLFCLIILWIIECKSSFVRRIKKVHDKKNYIKWISFHNNKKIKILLFFILVLAVVVITYFINLINTLFVPDCVKTFKHATFPDFLLLAIPGIFIAIPLSVLMLMHLIQAKMSKKDFEDYFIFLVLKDSIDYFRFFKRLLIIFIILSAMLIFFFDNEYICAGEEGIIFRLGFPWTERYYDYDQIKEVKLVLKARENEGIVIKKGYIVFSDSFILDFKRRFYPNHEKVKLLKYISEKSGVSEVVSDF